MKILKKYCIIQIIIVTIYSLLYSNCIFEISQFRAVWSCKIRRILAATQVTRNSNIQFYNKTINYQFAESRSGDIKHSCADIKGLEALGFNPQYDIMSGLTEYINYSNTDKKN